ncbi:hypothetical protein BCAR13_110063 [Paraburkholderia caribensis]|nr:hypothetical protein BCAR13_110063 [Paraburkholderia caribensis]
MSMPFGSIARPSRFRFARQGLATGQSQSPDRYFLPSHVISTPAPFPDFATRPAPSNSFSTTGWTAGGASPVPMSFSCRKVSIASALKDFVIAASAFVGGASPVRQRASRC